ncbi:MAG TPA: sigma-54 dependent transcriptional regulator [bacterium]|nr:sigma-54 dependent transcriptional regulator [bacterium]
MQDRTINLLLVEDEDFDVRRIKNTIKFSEYKIEIKDIVSNGQEALELVRKNNKYHVVILDFQISGGLMGEQLIRKIKNIRPELQIIIVTKMTIQQTDFRFANKLIEAGAFWFCTKYPGDVQEYIYQPTDFIMAIVNAYKKRKLQIAKNNSEEKLEKKVQNILSEKKIIGKSLAIEKLRSKIEKYANTEANILIRGESGTGKELIATNIHHMSKRKYENFITVNCASLPKDLIESELFGYEEGAFTGAKGSRQGYFEQADKGTIFLDEIADFPLSAQAKLLRVLQDGEIDKIGRKGKNKVDVRVIAATNQDLKTLVADGEFREDLFYRLNVLTIYSPPLREHRDDIPALVNNYLDKYCHKMGMQAPPQITDEALKALRKYQWEGNVRQLENISQRLLLGGDQKISEENVREALGQAQEVGQKCLDDYFDLENIKPLREIEKEFRGKYIKFVRNHSETDADAAEKLGLAPPNFHRICKKLGLK